MNKCVTARTDSLVDLLGPTRAEIVTMLRDEPCSVSTIATYLGISEVAVRRHLSVLGEDGLVSGAAERGPRRGRPAVRYHLTDRGRRLFADRSGEVATDLLTYLDEQSGHDAVTDFLRWRQERVRARYASALAAAEEAGEDRVARLADLLTEDGFPSRVEQQPQDEGAQGDTHLVLTQGHCAIRDVAEAHPVVCELEAEMFADLLGVEVERQSTVARGASQCRCAIPASPPSADHTAGTSTAHDRNR